MRGFARVPVDAIPTLVESGVISVQGAVYLCLLRWAREDGTAFCPRRRIADALGTTPEKVSNAMVYLKRKGIVETVAPGHNGRAAVYRVYRGGGDGGRA